jgi:uncharacterized membrane protein YbhN (UPF0104 family)
MPKIILSDMSVIESAIAYCKTNAKYLIFVAKLIFTLACFVFVTLHVYENSEVFTQIWFNWDDFRFIYLAYAMLLIIPNIGFESSKWYFLAQKIDKIPISSAIKGVLSGITLGMVTPHAIGDYIARMYFFQSESSYRSVGAILLARICQFAVTVVYGIIAFLILLKYNILPMNHFLNLYTMFLVALFVFIFFVLFLYFEEYSILWSRFKIFTYIKPYMDILIHFEFYDLIWILFLSVLRYLVFTAQYLLILLFLGVEQIDILILTSIWMIFLAKSLFPTFSFLNDLGVREAAAIFFFGLIELDIFYAVCSSFLIWILNAAIPAILGGILLWTKK